MWSCDLTANNLTDGQIAGIVIGSVAFVGLIILCVTILVFVLHRRKNADTIAISEYTPAPAVTIKTTTSTYQSPTLPPCPPDL